MWTELRKNIETIRQDNSILEDEFKPVDIFSWQKIQEKIFSTFCNIQNHKDKFNWLWEDFKNDTHSVQFDRNYPFDSLIQLIDNSEEIWVFINESANDGTKFWFYEGRIKTIAFVLEESFIDEVYIASKKYEWLICINHHDTIIATGFIMPDKLRELERLNLLK